MEAYTKGYKAGFHHQPLFYAWIILANFALLIASLKWWKYSFYFHLLFGIAIITLTLLSTIHILVPDWISPDAQRVPFQKVHNIAGLIITIWLGAQILTGLLARIIQYLPGAGTNSCYWFKRLHNYSSYLLMYLAKFNYFNIKIIKEKYKDFGLYLALQIVFFVIFIWFKNSYWTLSQEIVDSQLISKPVDKQNKLTYIYIKIIQKLNNLKEQIFQKSFKIPQVTLSLAILKSENQIPIENYVLFNDYVYNLNNLNGKHPGGIKIIEAVKKREINRFLYGFYKLESNSSAVVHSHSKQSMRLCGKPIAKIQRLKPIYGLKSLDKYQIEYSQNICSRSYVYLLFLKSLNLSKQNYTDFKFEGYTHASQFGQYFSLTIANQIGKKRCTRLYTTVWCLRPHNLEFMEKYFPGSTKLNFQQSISSDSSPNLQQVLIRNEDKQYDRTNKQVIPLAIKKYQQGRFTQRLLIGNFKGQLILSELIGSGLKYHELKDKNKVIFVCGGTGVLPFCDLIDILFKRVQILENSNISQYIIKQDKLSGQDLMKSREFIFYYATENRFDTFPTCFYQLNYLSQSKHIKFKAFVKIKGKHKSISSQYKYLTYQDDHFDNQIFQHLKQNISKIYICGPTKMNDSFSKMFEQNQVRKEIYQFL